MFIHVECVNGQHRVSGQATRVDGPGPGCLRAAWRWDGARLVAQVDRYGFRPLYYAAIRDGVAVADSVSELLHVGADAQQDDEAIAVFLRLGYFIGNDTPFSSVRAFPVGGVLTWTAADGLDVQAHPVRTRTDGSIGKREALDAYVDVFRQAVATSLPGDPGRTVLPLSGGRDSRHIAYELHRHGFRPGLVICQRHFSYRSNEDARVAALVAEALGWPLTISEQARCPLQSEHEKNRLLDGMAQEHAWYLPTARRILDGGYTSVFDGIAGDVLSNGLFCRAEWQALYDAAQWPELFRSMSGSGAGEPALSAVLAPGLAKRWSFDAALGRWRRELEQHAAEDDPITRFEFWNRTRRCIAPCTLACMPRLDVHMPYLDDAVFDHLASLPRRFFESRDFHDQAIARAAPQFAHIPYENKDEPADISSYEAALVRAIAKSPRYWGSAALNQKWLRPRLAAALFSDAAARRLGWVAGAAAAAQGLESLASH